MNNMHLVELTEAEVNQVSGGVAWVPIAVGIFVAGIVVEAYNEYNENKRSKKKQPDQIKSDHFNLFIEVHYEHDWPYFS